MPGSTAAINATNLNTGNEKKDEEDGHPKSEEHFDVTKPSWCSVVTRNKQRLI